MTRGSEERIVDGSLGRAKDLEVDFPKLVEAVVRARGSDVPSKMSAPVADPA